MDAFYEEDEYIVGHAADSYHRVDVRSTSRHLLVCDTGRVVAETRRPLVLYETGSSPRWYVPREDIDESALTPVVGQSFCPYKGLATYYRVGQHDRAAWSYLNAWAEVDRVRNLVSFAPDAVAVFLDGRQLDAEPDETAIAHGLDTSDVARIHFALVPPDGIG